MIPQICELCAAVSGPHALCKRSRSASAVDTCAANPVIRSDSQSPRTWTVSWSASPPRRSRSAHSTWIPAQKTALPTTQKRPEETVACWTPCCQNIKLNRKVQEATSDHNTFCISALIDLLQLQYSPETDRKNMPGLPGLMHIDDLIVRIDQREYSIDFAGFKCV